jgi:hypothetical protein
MGIVWIGTDGVLRSLTVDRIVIDAQGLSKILFDREDDVSADIAAPEQIHAFESRVLLSHRVIGDGIDGTKTDRGAWYKQLQACFLHRS